ncbi:MAG: septal ring lytic transglycosylase RlpA family protein, partial [Nitrospinae bacterium]|nr:septal ring lytic transglycosylase RlpA family protein [Nitrospinota bacterium]
MSTIRPLLPLTLVLALALSACSADTARLRRQTGAGSAVSSVPAPQGALKKSRPYTINGVTYYPLADAYGYEETGVASWYGKDFHGKKTANGEIYDMDGLTAAHKTLPLGTMVEVYSFDSERTQVLRVNDRGPFVGTRIIDLSREGARRLGIMEKGTGKVRVTALAAGVEKGPDHVPTPTAPLPDFEHGRFFVQVGAFTLRANAERMQGNLGYPLAQVRLVDWTARDGQRFTRVQVGPFDRMTLAKEALTALFDRGVDGGFV